MVFKTIKEYFFEPVLREIVKDKLYQADLSGATQFISDSNYFIICVAKECYLGRDAFFPFGDVSPISAEDIMKVVKKVDEAINSGKKVIIHCGAGISRSVMFSLAYLMYKNKWNVEEAINRTGFNWLHYIMIDNLKNFEQFLKNSSI